MTEVSTERGSDTKLIDSGTEASAPSREGHFMKGGR